jgi:hypothetical protein
VPKFPPFDVQKENEELLPTEPGFPVAPDAAAAPPAPPAPTTTDSVAPSREAETKISRYDAPAPPPPPDLAEVVIRLAPDPPPPPPAHIFKCTHFAPAGLVQVKVPLVV